MDFLSSTTRKKWISIVIVVALSSVVAAFDGLRPFGLIAGMEQMRLINITLTLALATTGPLMWARTSRRFRHLQWLRHAAVEWTHRLVGLAYLPLILLWDFYYETGEDAGASEMAVLEAINKPLLIALLTSAALLFLKWPRPLMRHYAVLKYFHIAAASTYMLKFFAEPFLGGKLG